MAAAQVRLKSEMLWQKELAWYAAVLPSLKKIPSLNNFLGRKKPKQTTEQMQDAFNQWRDIFSKKADHK